MAFKQPVGQKRLTNVAVVRYKKAGKRFEIACYRNKVISWRNKVEKDIDEVLQTHSVFANVSKGQLATKEDLATAFGTDNQDEICLLILDKGEYQVSDQERALQLENSFREIATIVADKCVDRDTQRPLTVSMVERALKELHFGVQLSRASKQQALEAIKLLKEKMPIERAQMKLTVTCPARFSKGVKDKMTPLIRLLVAEDQTAESYNLTCQIDPGSFRTVDEVVRKETRGQGAVQLLDTCVHQEGDENF